MLTPVDIQQKKFSIGIGYDKKDVNTFFDSVAESYETLYRSNAELKEKVETLTDGLQHYKSKEAALEKSLMLAEKDSEDTKSRANKEAKNIELEAKNKAKIILSDAEERLEQIKLEVAELETRYAAYKSNFATMLKKQAEFLGEIDFDVDAKIDDRAFALIAGSMPQQAAPAGDFGSFSGDPQMRDESTLGGMASSGGSMGGGDMNSTSAVYTSMLSANENFVDPFNPNKEENGRYNPYDGKQPEKKKKSGGQTFTVNTSGKPRKSAPKQAPKQEQKESASTPSVAKDAGASTRAYDKAQVKDAEEVKKAVPDDTVKSVDKPKNKEFDFDDVDKIDTIPTVDFSSVTDTSDEEFVGDVESKTPETALIGDGDSSDSEETDEFGFEFI